MGYCKVIILVVTVSSSIALMHVFPKTTFLTTKPRFEVKRKYMSKQGLVMRTITLGKTFVSAICDIKVVYSSSHIESTVSLDSQLHRDYYTVLHLPFFGSVNKSPTMN